MAIQDPLTELIIGCCFRVANEMGPGFLEKVYENALAHELRKAKVKVVQQQGIEVFYDGVNAGQLRESKDPGSEVGDESRGGDRGCGIGCEGRPVVGFLVYPALVCRG